MRWPLSVEPILLDSRKSFYKWCQTHDVNMDHPPSKVQHSDAKSNCFCNR
eukprot:m.70839 g.70839  ORF g.70839 m.70839 type:complete len:50 (+) comp20111_c1_seq6:499-648(+)